MAQLTLNMNERTIAGEKTFETSNGWNCFFTKRGSFVAVCEREYSDGIHTASYTITPNGFAKLSIENPRGKKITRKGFIVKKGEPVVGVVGLSGGYVDNRYAYFRDIYFIKYLEDNGLDKVVHETPNQEFMLYNYRLAGLGNERHDKIIETDGEIEICNIDDVGENEGWYDKYPNTSAYKQYVYKIIKGATYAVVEKGGVTALYTLRKDLPVLGQKKEEVAY